MSAAMDLAEGLLADVKDILGAAWTSIPPQEVALHQSVIADFAELHIAALIGTPIAQDDIDDLTLQMGQIKLEAKKALIEACRRRWAQIAITMGKVVLGMAEHEVAAMFPGIGAFLPKL